MQFRPSTARQSFVLAAVLLAGCASLGSRTQDITFERTVALPCDVVATITAAAVRSALPFSDPMPEAIAVAATPLSGNAFRIDYEQDCCGHWLPRATSRLAIQVPDDPTADAVVKIEASPLTAFGRGASSSLRVDVMCTPDGTRVQAVASLEVVTAIERALAIAVEPSRATPGLDEANLATFVGHRLWRRGEAALAQGNTGAGRALLQRAARLPGASPRLLARLTVLTASSGDIEMARDLCLRALVATPDPLQRSQLAAQWSALQPNDDPARAMRREARARIDRHDLFGAESLLHTARRDDPRPAEDYRLLALLHRERHDASAFACELLAAEHAHAAREQPSLAGFVRLVHPMLANAFASFAAPHPAAAPGH